MRTGSHCRSFGSAIDCLTVYRVYSTTMSVLCSHRSIRKNKDVGNAARHARISFIS